MSKQIRPLLSLVIPAYNEAHRLPATLGQIRDRRAAWDFDFEIIVVVEPSTDGTYAIAEAARSSLKELVVIGNPVHRGKGFAVKTGMLQARGELIFFTDADLSTPLDDLERALTRLQADNAVDIIIGSRQHRDSLILQHQNPVRELMGKTFNRFVRGLAGLAIADTQCGFKGFRRLPAHAIFRRQKTDGFAFDVEVLLLARAMNFSLVEMPVRWSNSPESRVRVISDSIRMLHDLTRIRRLVQATMREIPYVEEPQDPVRRGSSEPQGERNL
jgi:dolichyl-phosphate beta-glucosyltransferase